MQALKTTFLFAVLMVIVMTAHATIRTVSNYPTNAIGQFNTIQGAIDASSNGDSIFVHGSPNNYAGFTLNNKRLAIFGPGWAPDKNFSFRATINTSSTITGSLCARSEIHGLVFDESIVITSSKPDSLRFYRNQINININMSQASTTYRNYIIEGNFFYSNNSIVGNTSSIYENMIVRNNILYHNFGNFPSSSMINFNHPSSSILIDHNLWYGATDKSCFISCAYLTISNNIFVSRNAAIDNSLSVFNNNITFLTAASAPWTVNGNVDAGGNEANQNPQMVDQNSVNNGNSNPLLNFTVQDGSLADGTGSDGEDMGLLYEESGSLNWANSRNSRLPRVFSMNITNPTIQVNGILNVNVDARKSN